MKKITLWLFALFSCLQIHAQVSLYSFSQSNGSYNEITGGTVLGTSTTTTSFDSQVWNLPSNTIPFNFTFNGTAYTGLNVNSNGFITFGATAPTTTTTTPISSTTAYSGAVSAWAGDLCGVYISNLITGEVRWEVVGSAPNREFVIQFKNWRTTYSSSTTDVAYINFQFRLLETTNQVKVVYGPNGYALGSSTFSGTRQIGLRGATASDFKTRTNTTSQLFTASTSGTANSSTQAYNTTVATPGMPTNGLTYTWTPPVPCSGTPVAGVVTPAIQNLCANSTPLALTLTGNSEGFTGLTFQWETSTDNAAWVNATGASATTAVYSPPAFTGAGTVYYRCKITCTASSLFSYSNVVTVNPPANPANQVSNLNFTNINYFGFTANWTNAEGNRRVVYISTSPIVDPVNGSAPALTANTTYSGSGQQIVYDNTGSSVTVTGLQPNTQYYVKVIEYLRCGSAAPYDYYYNLSSGTNANTVTTSPPTALPWQEGFATTTLPVNWVNTGFTLSSTVTGLAPALDGNYIYKNLYSTATTGNLVTPIFEPIPANYRFTYNYKLSNYSSPYGPVTANTCTTIIAISTNNGTSYTDVVSIPNDGQAGWQSYSLDLAAYVGQSIRIKVTTNWTSGDYYIAFDKFKIEPIPTCPDMTGLVTSGVTAFGANTSWDDMSNFGASGYQYAVTTSATPPTSGTNTTSTFYVASGLTPQTTYYLHVRSSCSDGTYGNWSSVSFTTTCAPVIVFPVLEPFATFLPSCWLKGDNGTLIAGPATFGSNSWIEDGFGNNGSTGAIRYNIFVASANDWIISPQYTIPASGYELRYKAAATNYGLTTAVTNWESDDFVEVLVSTTGTDNWSVLYTYNNSNVPAPTGEMNIIDLDSYAGQTVRFAYRVVEGTSDGPADIDFFVDDFEIRLSPTCPDITGLIVGGVTSSTANTSWNDMSNGGALAYEYAITTSATPPTSGTSTTATFYAASGLLPQTIYYLHVRSSCTGGTFGNWSTVSFTTACAEVTSFIQNFDTVTTPAFPDCWFKVGTIGTANTQASSSSSTPNCLYIYGSSATNQAIVRTIPVSNLGAGTHRFKFKMRANFTVGGILELGYLTNPTDSNSFVALTSFTASSLTTYLDYVYNVPAGTYSNYPAFRHTGSPANSILVDDVVWEALPSCPDMTGLVVSGVTAFGANTSWNDMSNGGALGYEYAVTTSATPPTSGTATTSTFYVASGLAPQTVYYLHVRSSCTGGAFGNWSTITFTTACSPITALPWNEGFEGLTTVGATNFPSCWFKENGDWTSQNTNGTYSTANTGIKYIRNSYSATNEYIWTPGFDLVAGTSYDFSSFIQGDNGTGWVVDYFVNTAQNSTGATQIGTTYNVPGTGTTYTAQAYNKVTATFVPATSGTYYFAVRVNQPSASPWYVSFDDFELKLTPATPPSCATGLTATPNATCGNFASTLSWTAEPLATGYYVTIGTTSGGSDIANAVPVSVTSYSFSGLNNTQYFWKVVPYNGAGSATGCTEQSFTTAVNGCYCASVPTSNDGSGITNAIIGSNPYVIADVTYVDNTATPNVINSGANANIQLTFSTGYSYDINIWIDFNNDFDFDDAGELVKTGIACTNVQPNTVDASFTMPLTAPSGLHRMRIGTADTGQVPPAPCYNGTYGVTLDFTVDTSLATSSFDLSNFVAYPNPVKDVLNLSYSSTITNVKVTNLLGQQVINKNVNDTNVQVNMADLAVGTYIVNISSGDLIHTIKVIKQ